MCLIAYHLIPLQLYTLQSLASIFYRQMNWGLERLTCPRWKVSKKQNWEMNSHSQILPCDCLATKVLCLHGIRQTQWAFWRLVVLLSKWRMERGILRRRTKTSEGIISGVSMVHFKALKRNCPNWIQSLNNIEHEDKIGQIQWCWVTEINKGTEEFYETIFQFFLFFQCKITELFHLLSVSSSAASSNSIRLEMNHGRPPNIFQTFRLNSKA